jgi:hypothetical protein
MRLRLFTISGLLLGLLILLAATLNAPAASLSDFRAAEEHALQQDKAVASNSQQPCSNPLLRVTAPDRVLQEGETETIAVHVTNTDTAECDLTLSLVAPAFTLQPTDNQQLVRLTPTTSADVHWTVRAMTTGTATIAVTSGNASQQVGVSVVSSNAFLPPQRATLNYLGSILGALLAIGSLLFGGLQRSRKESEEATVPATSTPPQAL